MQKLAVNIGDVRAAADGTVLFTIGLGSCVAIVLYDGVRNVGGLAHAMLPDPSSSRRPAPPGRFASTAVPELVRLMEECGARKHALRARLAGGASMFASVLPESGRQLGMRNVEAARVALAALRIPVDNEDVGGSHGRSVFLHTCDGRVVVTSVYHDDITL